MGMALKIHYSSTRPSGTTHVGSSKTEQNYSVQRSVRNPQKVLLMTLLIARRGSPARVLVRKVLPLKHHSFVTNLHQMGSLSLKKHQHLGLISLSGRLQ